LFGSGLNDTFQLGIDSDQHNVDTPTPIRIKASSATKVAAICGGDGTQTKTVSNLNFLGIFSEHFSPSY